MNSVPRPYLKVTRRAWIHRGISSTSSCSTFTHSTGPIPAGKVKTSGSAKGRRAAIRASAVPTPPAPTRSMRMGQILS